MPEFDYDVAEEYRAQDHDDHDREVTQDLGLEGTRDMMTMILRKRTTRSTRPGTMMLKKLTASRRRTKMSEKMKVRRNSVRMKAKQKMTMTRKEIRIGNRRKRMRRK